MLETEYEKKDWRIYDGELTYVGHILKVDMEYDQSLHLSHSSLPLAPHKIDIDEKMLSPFARKLLLELRGTDKHQSTKLVSDFQPRKDYIVHSRSLALYLQLGMRVTKIHAVLEFETSDFLKDYITFCTNKRLVPSNNYEDRARRRCNSSSSSG